ncbi:putative F-box domain-containing protein [Rosa chinensis]|uniref:Putative F-box domain-containing protein n=1 Tax=Rosa chinensis TaxID=74649 RepID=A0A2P6QLK9_ROSCH|nr:F-box/kelch-repeat protein At3g06240 [Rosa chinensis]PRQ35063.1 putative F-box domain-containing protein [Rosa chinensis]
MSSCVVDLPEDIILKILCRLPVKSLIRFTCVSKRWRSMIISDPQFGKSHHQLASQQRTLRREVLLTTYPKLRDPGPISLARSGGFFKLPPRFQSLEDNFSVKNFTIPCEKSEDIIVMASCNGLVLVGESNRGYLRNLSIWNPSTGCFRNLPRPSFPERSVQSAGNEYKFSVNYGFGHVSASDDYKLVFIIPALGDLPEVHVFSMRANIWKVITAPYSSWPRWRGGQGTLSNEAIHWVIRHKNESSDPVIYAFDLAEEGFRQVPLPLVLWQDEDDKTSTEITTLVHLGGSLCILSRKHYYPVKGEVWAMTEYGVPESWVKLFQFDVRDLPDVFSRLYGPWDICFITESNIIMLRRDNELFWFERRNEEKLICSGQYRIEEVQPEVPECSCYFHAIGYDETLVSVAE